MLQWKGLRRFHFCKRDSEYSAHLFIHCPFTKRIWLKIKFVKKFNQDWSGIDLDDCLSNWTSDKTAPPCLVAHICWFIWLERNATIFEGKEPSVHLVVIKTLGFLHKPVAKMFSPRLRSCWIEQTLEYSVACIYGATQEDGRCSGIGGIIKLLASTIYKWFLNCGAGTNTKEELMRVWATLFIANHFSIHKLQILRDSKVIIDWLNNKSDLRVSTI